MQEKLTEKLRKKWQKIETRMKNGVEKAVNEKRRKREKGRVEKEVNEN